MVSQQAPQLPARTCGRPQGLGWKGDEGDSSFPLAAGAGRGQWRLYHLGATCFAPPYSPRWPCTAVPRETHPQAQGRAPAGYRIRRRALSREPRLGTLRTAGKGHFTSQWSVPWSGKCSHESHLVSSWDDTGDGSDGGHRGRSGGHGADGNANGQWWLSCP